MSEKALRTRAERRLWNARWLAAMFFALAMLLGLLTYERGHALVQGYGAALAFGLIGICLYRGEYHADRVYGLGPVSYTHLDVYKRQDLGRPSRPAA